MIRIVAMLFLVTTLLACNSPEPSAAHTTQTDQSLATDQNDQAAVEWSDHEMQIDFTGTDKLVETTGVIDSVGQQLICVIRVAQSMTLNGELVPQKKNANLRFISLEMPDGSTDGPFGRTVNYQLPEAGTYRLTIGMDNMAENAYTGPFQLTLQVQQTSR